LIPFRFSRGNEDKEPIFIQLRRETHMNRNESLTSHRPPLRRKLRRNALACAVAHALRHTAVMVTTAGIAMHAAHAQDADAVKRYTIPAGQLTASLNHFGRDAGILLSFSSQITNSLQSKGLNGAYTVPAALQVLLSDTGLEAIRQPNGGYTLRQLPRTSAQEAVLPLVTVTPGQENPSGPVNGYLAKRTTTGTKTDTPIMEIPQSISVVGRQQIQDLKAQTIQDSLGYTAGLMTGISAKNPLFDDTLNIRGFEANPQLGSYYRDGMRYMTNLYNGKQEIYGLERVEVLKGPSSILYGSAAPGGVINTVTKRPPSTPLHEVNVEYGSYNRKQLSADIGGPLDDEGVWSYRLTALERKSDTYMKYGRDDRTYVAPALTWRPSAATSLTLLTSYQKTDAIYPPSLPVTGTLLPNPNGQLDRNTFLGEPNNNYFQTETSTAGYLFEHAFSDTLKLRNAVRYYKSDLAMRYTLITGDVDALTKRRVPRSARGYNDDTSMMTTDTNLEKTFYTGPVKHTALVGVDYTKSRYDSDRRTGTLPTIDIYNPVYQTGAITTTVNRVIRSRESKLGGYLQDQIKIADKLVVLLGGRYDHVNVVTRSLLGVVSSADETDIAFTGRAGMVYLADNGVAPFVSVSQSFEPTTGLSRTGTRFEPSKGKQFELGLRYQPPGTETMYTASLFDLTRTNVLSQDPVDTSFQIQTGEVRSRGLELEAKTSLDKYVDVIGAYTYTDAVVTRSTLPNETGERFYAPRNLFSLWVDTKLGFIDLARWRVGAGLRYVSDRPDKPATGTRGGSAYTLVDARIGYENGPWTYALNATNLTDEVYIPSMCYTNVCDYGAPRQVTATLSYRW
jgi:iron complex outermembrane receptor protein